MAGNMADGGEDVLENLLDAEFELEMESKIKEVSLFSLILHILTDRNVPRVEFPLHVMQRKMPCVYCLGYY